MNGESELVRHDGGKIEDRLHWLRNLTNNKQDNNLRMRARARVPVAVGSSTDNLGDMNDIDEACLKILACSFENYFLLRIQEHGRPRIYCAKKAHRESHNSATHASVGSRVHAVEVFTSAGNNTTIDTNQGCGVWCCCWCCY